MAAVVALPIALNFVGLGKVTDLLLRVARWPLLLVIVTMMLAVIYRYGPSRTEARWRWVSWGGAFAAIVWVLVSLAFSWYVAHFGSYNKTYGSLGAAIGFMTWIWISATIVLIGAELNAEMEHQTKRDTTTGRRSRSARAAPIKPTPWRRPENLSLWTAPPARHLLSRSSFEAFGSTWDELGAGAPACESSANKTARRRRPWERTSCKR